MINQGSKTSRFFILMEFEVHSLQEPILEYRIITTLRTEKSGPSLVLGVYRSYMAVIAAKH